MTRKNTEVALRVVLTLGFTIGLLLGSSLTAIIIHIFSLCK